MDNRKKTSKPTAPNTRQRTSDVKNGLLIRTKYDHARRLTGFMSRPLPKPRFARLVPPGHAPPGGTGVTPLWGKFPALRRRGEPACAGGEARASHPHK